VSQGMRKERRREKDEERGKTKRGDENLPIKSLLVIPYFVVVVVRVLIAPIGKT
jgi:hypothetical protein